MTVYKFSTPATDASRTVRFPLGTAIFVGSLAQDPVDGSMWQAFKVEEDAGGRNVMFRPASREA